MEQPTSFTTLAVNMLSVLAGATLDGSWNRIFALGIVKELGYLPLAIEQVISREKDKGSTKSSLNLPRL